MHHSAIADIAPDAIAIALNSAPVNIGSIRAITEAIRPGLATILQSASKIAARGIAEIRSAAIILKLIANISSGAKIRAVIAAGMTAKQGHGLRGVGISNSIRQVIKGRRGGSAAVRNALLNINLAVKLRSN
jgi:hypothetical protein